MGTLYLQLVAQNGALANIEVPFTANLRSRNPRYLLVTQLNSSDTIRVRFLYFSRLSIRYYIMVSAVGGRY